MEVGIGNVYWHNIILQGARSTRSAGRTYTIWKREVTPAKGNSQTGIDLATIDRHCRIIYSFHF